MRVLVTGAASGIGAALMMRLGAGAIGLDRAGADITCDLADPSAIAAVAGQIEGTLDAIAHVAGVPGTAHPAQILAINAYAPGNLTAALLPRLRDGGSIVAVSSVTAHRCSWTADQLDALLMNRSAPAPGLDGARTYELSKAALNRWALCLAVALRPRRIRVNTVSPGPVETPILADFKTSIGAARIDAAAAMVGRHAQPQDIADVIGFLLGDQARWVNGTDVRTDGGYHAVRAVEG